MNEMEEGSITARHTDRAPSSLYRLLGAAAPAATDGAQTTQTATKETVDNDREDLERKRVLRS